MAQTCTVRRVVTFFNGFHPLAKHWLSTTRFLLILSPSSSLSSLSLTRNLPLPRAPPLFSISPSQSVSRSLGFVWVLSQSWAVLPRSYLTSNSMHSHPFYPVHTIFAHKSRKFPQSVLPVVIRVLLQPTEDEIRVYNIIHTHTCYTRIRNDLHTRSNTSHRPITSAFFVQSDRSGVQCMLKAERSYNDTWLSPRMRVCVEGYTCLYRINVCTV